MSSEEEALAGLERRMTEATIGPLEALDGPVLLTPYDPTWPDRFRAERSRIRAALGDAAIDVEHAGSTSVPGLAAKPIIDIVLTVADSADEPAYVPAMEGAGYVLRIREPDWFEHRLFKSPHAAANIHVFSANCPEVDRMLMFRDRLRANAEDRRLYLETKQQLVARRWAYVQQYADAKADVVRAILERATAEQGRPRAPE